MKEILPPDKPFEALTASEWLENEGGVRARCEQHALLIEEIARATRDEMRRSMDFWVGSWDYIPRNARMRAENEALAKYGLAPRFNLEEEAARPRGRGVTIMF